VEFLPQGSTINADAYCDTKKLRHAMQNKRRCMLSRGVVMLYDNARPHTAAAMRDLIATFGWEQFDHLPYSSDLASSDLHVFQLLKTFLGGRRFHEDNEIKEAVNTWFASQVTSFYDAGIQKLVSPFDRCLNNGANYVEK
jgi:histone-lysine N-methyltransferase SETMAR